MKKLVKESLNESTETEIKDRINTLLHSVSAEDKKKLLAIILKSDYKNKSAKDAIQDGLLGVG